MENTNIILDMDQAYDESLDKIFELLEEKKYFRCRDELLKHNEVEIAEMLVDIRRKFDLQRMVVLFRALPKDVSVDVFAELSTDDRLDIIDIITDPELGGDDAEAMDAVVYDRNRAWAAKLVKIMPERACLVCVGAGHLPGDQGLLQLLRNRGYTVEPMQQE